jgi:hypothetical protein
MKLSSKEKAVIFHLLYSDLIKETKNEMIDRIHIERGESGLFFSTNGLEIQEVKRNLLRRLMKEKDFPKFLSFDFPLFSGISEEGRFPEVVAFLLGLDELVSDETLRKWAKGTEDVADPRISRIAKYFLKKRTQK